MSTKLHNIEDINVPPQRLRDISQTGVDYIANSFEVVGQLQPIIISKVLPFDKLDELDADALVLRAGAHRLEAAKKLGWHHIEAKEVVLTGHSPEMAEIIVQIVEVDENLGRVDLDQAGRTRFMGKRFELTEARMVLERRVKAEQELEAANAARTAALAEKKRAKGKEAKAAAVKAFERAEADRVNAAHRLERANVVDFSPAGEETATSLSDEFRNAERGVAAVVAKELGIKRAVVQNLKSFRRALGDEFLKAVEGTRLGTKNEMEAMIRLKRDFPEQAARIEKLCIKKRAEGKPNQMEVPSGLLGKLTQQRAADEARERFKTEDGRMEHLRKEAQDALNALGKLVQAVGNFPREERHRFDKAMKAHELINELTTMVKKTQVQKRTGTEHRYGQENEGPTRVEAAKELVEHADEIERIVKEKANPKGKKKKQA